jgi:hypothetical protein
MRDDDMFAAVASAYLYMGLLETGLAADERAFIDTDQRFLCDTIKHINEAVADLLGADPAKAPPACSEIESTSATS